ncbi:MAG: hypothetical protein ACPGUD_03235 [Parashewanella sp.]
MKLSVKAILFSAFVAPGSGHILVGKRLQGYSLLAITLIALIMLLNHIMRIANQISQEILSGAIPFDIIKITQAIHQSMYADIFASGRWEFQLLVFCWLVALVDCVRMAIKENTLR